MAKGDAGRLHGDQTQVFGVGEVGKVKVRGLQSEFNGSHVGLVQERGDDHARRQRSESCSKLAE